MSEDRLPKTSPMLTGRTPGVAPGPVQRWQSAVQGMMGVAALRGRMKKRAEQQCQAKSTTTAPETISAG